MPELRSQKYRLAATTQGPLYPPAEVMDQQGNFVVVGMVPGENGPEWRSVIVAADSPLPAFGETAPYKILRDIEDMSQEECRDIILHTLPLPVPLNNYGMVFAPEQRPLANTESRPSLPLHEGYIADYRSSDGKRHIPPVNLADWIRAEGILEIHLSANSRRALFKFSFRHLVPDSVYTVMSLREKDLATENPSRPGPLGIPNAFITDHNGNADYWAELPDPFPAHERNENRIINVVVLYMSSRQSYGGAIGLYGLGGDIHAHLKLKSRSFDEFITIK
ncbi:hypothetical protein WB66_16775 [bacteria symbiont BFo1 of Frankliniella occidentalis]|jgi:hypothetical protein|uniref:hypothetical protein n=1 Tax=Erwinia aphidicola TaxID=68334 RepID=UPI00066459B1|nr:hypothetical protein [Erwinia aphidicola]KMV69460.1 hypothetical protein AI28_17410 [bacteria symbiont BFo1 of Frankliniella occidentalis]PIJ53224.1 hypothetical protein BOM23_21680 [Erwinia sp. OLMDLW33]KYP83664.1 hypothetical protein WB66_16775 [bacteria symbiont BFo1 of Frankliniella occidentalis]KYP88963.1 hypothetical protein WB91_15545 [bacteria symbiont BFo1 of Frankliniella occidentalis]CAH0306881.1 hypothetical protein SRABI13_04595 [Erwinia aphidicola]